MGKLCVLVSGGQDSTVAYHLAKRQLGEHHEVIPLFVDCGQPYVDKEIRALENLRINYIRVKAPLAAICIDDYGKVILDNMPTVEKQEIHGRNLLLAFYGALIADRVWLSVLENELLTACPDKSIAFFEKASDLFSLVFSQLRKRTIVTTPFSTDTKSDVIQRGLEFLGLTKEYLLKTVSCYSPDTKNCGKCIACFKRWISWANNGITERFDSDPMESDYARKVINKMMQGDEHYWRSSRRVAETHNALVIQGLHGVVNGWHDHQIPKPLHGELTFKF